MRFFHDGSTHQTKKKKHVSNFILLRLRCCVMWKIFTCVSVSSDWTIDFSSPNKRQKKWKKEKKIYWKWPYVWICSILSTYISNSSQGPIDHQTSSINWESPWAKNPYVRCFAIFEAVEQVKHKIQGGSIFV